MKSHEFITEGVNSLESYIDYIEDNFDYIVTKYSQHITQDDSTSSAPDTTKFRAERSGSLSIIHDLKTSGGKYGSPKYFSIAIKVGQNIAGDIHQKIASEVQTFWLDVVENNPESVEKDAIKTREGLISYSAEVGTNFAVYGITMSKRNDMKSQKFTNEDAGESNPVIDADGTKRWLLNGKRHRDNDLPAMIQTDGTKHWYVNGQLHRDNDMPAVIDANGSKHWYVNGKRHRDDGMPAYVANASNHWYVNGKRHRNHNMPSSIWSNGTKHWYVNGKFIK